MCPPVHINQSAAQPPIGQDSETAADESTDASETDELSAIDSRVTTLETIIQTQQEANARSFDAMQQSTDRAFNILIWLGAIIGGIGTLLGTVIITLTWMRDRQQHEDYQRERQFYEERAQTLERHLKERHELERTDYERERRFYETSVAQSEVRTRATHDASLELAKLTAQFQKQLSEQQLTIGESISSRSGDMLGKQIDSITKLGGVIDLVQQAFDLQVKREKEQKGLQKQLAIMQDTVSSVNEHFLHRYQEVEQIMASFGAHSRMAWTRLTQQEEVVTSRARLTFETIPKFTFDAFEAEEQYKLGKHLQLLGTSAFYANDIDAAVKYLDWAKKIFGAATPVEFLYPRAFSLHYLGLIEKSWCHEQRSREANFGEARRHLDAAAQLLKTAANEFLTPVTLGEVMSYIEADRSAAREHLEAQTRKLDSLRIEPGGLDPNQEALLRRACVIIGNLDFLEGDLPSARDWYQRAIAVREEDHFAWLSKALATEAASTERKESFVRGLDFLTKSDALRKREDVVRLTAVAWAAIAAQEIGEKEESRKWAQELSEARLVVRPVAGREPLFFSPTRKVPVSLKELLVDVEAHTT